MLENCNVLSRPDWGLETPWTRVANKPFAVSEWNFCGLLRTGGLPCERCSLHGGVGVPAGLGGAPACVWMTSLDGEPLDQSGRILFVHLGDVQGEGVTYENASRTKVLKWGNGRFLMREGRAEVVITGIRPDLALWSLDMSGRRRRKLPLCRSGDAVSFVADVAADPDSATFIYVLEL